MTQTLAPSTLAHLDSVVFMRRAGHRHVDIADTIGISQGSVQRLLVYAGIGSQPQPRPKPAPRQRPDVTIVRKLVDCACSTQARYINIALPRVRILEHAA